MHKNISNPTLTQQDPVLKISRFKDVKYGCLCIIISL